MNPDNYYANHRPEMLAFIPPQPGRVLDVGCGKGGFGAMLKRRLPDAEVWGVEPVLAACAEASKVLDRALHGFFDESLALAEGSFDTIVFNDSLEHFPETMPPLQLARRLLKPGGRIVASIPNIRHWPDLKRFVFYGEWDYQDEGVMDRTHLRFFTRSSILKTFASAGLHVQRIEGLGSCWRGLRLMLAKLLLPRSAQDIRYLQFAVVATRAETVPAAPP